MRSSSDPGHAPQMTLSLPHVLVAASLVLVACGNGDPDDTSAPTATATTTASPTAGPSPTATPAPTSVAVAVVDAQGRLVLLDGDSGEQRRVLLDGIAVDDPSSNDIAVSPDRSTVFVVRPASAEQEPEIVQVSADGGSPQVVTSGRSPAVSPDGSTLAYVRVVEDSPAGFEPTLRLRDLDSGDERELTGGDFYAIQDLAWTADGQHLAFTAGEIKTGVHVLTRDATSLAAARRLGPESTDATWSDVAALSDGRLAVIERCCQIPDPDPDRWRVIAVDPRQGTTGDVVLDQRAVRIDGRADGEGLVLIMGGGPGGGPLLRWDGSGQARELATDVVVAAW